MEAAGGARVVGEDFGDDGEALDVVGAEIVAGVEIERRGSPEGPPSAGDRLRAGAVLGGEQGDDGAEDGIREIADEVAMGDEIGVPCPFPWPAPGGFTGGAPLGCG